MQIAVKFSDWMGSSLVIHPVFYFQRPIGNKLQLGFSMCLTACKTTTDITAGPGEGHTLHILSVSFLTRVLWALLSLLLFFFYFIRRMHVLWATPSLDLVQLRGKAPSQTKDISLHEFSLEEAEAQISRVAYHTLKQLGQNNDKAVPDQRSNILLFLCGFSAPASRLPPRCISVDGLRTWLIIGQTLCSPYLWDWSPGSFQDG